MLIESETLNTILCASQDPLPSHVFSGGHIWEENGRLQSSLIQAPEVIYGRKRKTSIHSHSSAGGHIWEGNGGLRSILTQALFSLSNPIAQPPPHKFFSTDCKGQTQKNIREEKIPPPPNMDISHRPVQISIILLLQIIFLGPRKSKSWKNALKKEVGGCPSYKCTKIDGVMQTNLYPSSGSSLRISAHSLQS